MLLAQDLCSWRALTDGGVLSTPLEILRNACSSRQRVVVPPYATAALRHVSVRLGQKRYALQHGGSAGACTEAPHLFALCPFPFALPTAAAAPCSCHPCDRKPLEHRRLTFNDAMARVGIATGSMAQEWCVTRSCTCYQGRDAGAIPQV